MPNMIVAVWKINTKKHASNPDARMAQLTHAVETAWGLMVGMSVGQDVNVVGETSFHHAKRKDISYLFVAPEYLFTAKDSHFMSEGSKELIRAQLVFLSLRFPDLLIIPGSVGWFKTSSRSGVTIFRKQTRLKSTSRDMSKYVDKYGRSINAVPDYSFAPSYLKEKFYDKPVRELNERKAINIDRYVVGLEKAPDTARVAKNTCFVLKSASVIHRYDKVFEADDSSDTDLTKVDLVEPILFMPGEGSPVFESNNISYGLELCVDHNFAALKIWVNKIKKAVVDIQIIMSASTGLEESHLVARKYVIQADSDSGAYVRSAKSDDPIERAAASGDVEIYNLDW
nr:hypothetical protein [uncultured Pseudomonas sp.]